MLLIMSSLRLTSRGWLKWWSPWTWWQPRGGGHLARVQGLPFRGGYTKWPCLGGFLVIEKKSLTSWLSFPFSVGAYFFPQICRWCNNELVPEWTLWLPVRQPSLVSSSWDYFYKRLRLFNSWSKPLKLTYSIAIIWHFESVQLNLGYL